MIIRYTELPASTASASRPILDVHVGNLDSIGIPCLVDSGAVTSLLPAWSAELAAIDLTGLEEEHIAVGGATVAAVFATVTLSVPDLTWEARIGFCEAWPYVWGLLGHESFFRWFTVTFRAADLEFEIEPIAA